MKEQEKTTLPAKIPLQMLSDKLESDLIPNPQTDAKSWEHGKKLLDEYKKERGISNIEGDAVKFAEWASKDYTYMGDGKWILDTDSGWNKIPTAQLYQLFLTSQSKTV